ncbi:cellulose biosynthesis cyclic di-GMP-binding regulatory protein BcsB [Tianweitania sediminis]|nr:cellulose biosynthesis cyclic di-GMP-binding regulatory protein BcsB [Tianweitania sediminis]
MSPERKASPPVKTEPPARQPATPAPAAKAAPAPSPAPSNGQLPVAPSPAPIASRPAPSGTPTDATLRRYVIPSDRLSLTGEIDSKQWTIQLSAEEAEAATTLNVAYQNAIVVAPETSVLRVFVNGVPILENPVKSPDGISEVAVPLPAGLVRQGSNLITIAAQQRHRTDCTIESTYELWTEIAPERTYLSFRGDTRRMTRLEDVASIGVDAAGKTRFNIIAPGIDVVTATKPVLRLAEGLAVYANMPNQSVQITQEAVRPAGSGSLNIVVGLPADVQRVLAEVPNGASVSPTISFVDDPETGAGTMVVTGPTWQAIETAVDTITTPVDRPIDTQRSALSTQAWHYPNAPIFFSGGKQSFAKLGASTQEFSGRRFRTEILIGIPADFYANDYGEARILLDAAYTADVLPGSHIDVYVNGNIASTLPITSGGGAILRQLPVSVTMRHFRPGANTIAVEAHLRTAADEACVPGGEADAGGRFVLFDTSNFEMPDFARMAQVPNLAGLAGTGFPYNRSPQPTPVVINGGGTASLSTAATFLAKMSVAAGRPLAIEPVSSMAMVGERDALFFGPISQFQPEVLAQVGIAPQSRMAWGDETALPQPEIDLQQTTATFEKWRDQLSNAGWRGQVSSLQEWLNRNFDITLESLRLTPRGADQFTPSAETSLLIAQRPAPDDEAVWTMVTAPTADALWEGAEGLAQTPQWNRVGGEMVLFNATEQSTSTHAVSTFNFRPTGPLTFANVRLVVANWLSGNVLSFAAALFVACMLLGVATLLLLQNLGRR